MNWARRGAGPLLLLLPGALTVYLGFNSGGLFPTATGFVAIVLALALIVRVALAADPFEGVSVPLALAGGALALLAAWTLASGSWSDSWARAALEFDRVAVYVLTLVLFGTIARTAPRLRVMVWGLAAAMVVLSAVGLVTRTLPDVWTLAPEAQNERLGYPIGYWNALGLVSALGLVFGLHLSSDDREPRVARVLGAAAIPILATTLFFTFSRGPLAAAFVGLLAYALVARPRLLPNRE